MMSLDTHGPLLEPPGPLSHPGSNDSPVPAAQECVLQHFAGQFGIAHNPQGAGEDESPVTRVERFEGQFVAIAPQTAGREHVSAAPRSCECSGARLNGTSSPITSGRKSRVFLGSSPSCALACATQWVVNTGREKAERARTVLEARVQIIPGARPGASARARNGHSLRPIARSQRTRRDSRVLQRRSPSGSCARACPSRAAGSPPRASACGGPTRREPVSSSNESITQPPSFRKPQDGHVEANDSPHSPQKRRPSRFSV